jgi:hypothetical protein
MGIRLASRSKSTSSLSRNTDVTTHKFRKPNELLYRLYRDVPFDENFNELISRQLSTLTHFPLPQKPLKPIEGALTLAIAPAR